MSAGAHARVLANARHVACTTISKKTRKQRPNWAGEDRNWALNTKLANSGILCISLCTSHRALPSSLSSRRCIQARSASGFPDHRPDSVREPSGFGISRMPIASRFIVRQSALLFLRSLLFSPLSFPPLLFRPFPSLLVFSSLPMLFLRDSPHPSDSLPSSSLLPR